MSPGLMSNGLQSGPFAAGLAAAEVFGDAPAAELAGAVDVAEGNLSQPTTVAPANTAVAAKPGGGRPDHIHRVSL